MGYVRTHGGATECNRTVVAMAPVLTSMKSEEFYVASMVILVRSSELQAVVSQALRLTLSICPYLSMYMSLKYLWLQFHWAHYRSSTSVKVLPQNWLVQLKGCEVSRLLSPPPSTG